MHIPGWLETLDKELFTNINATYALPAIDPLMRALREPGIWVPLYIFIIYYCFKHLRPYAWMFLLLSVVCFAIADFSSAAIFKPYFMRPRPCHDDSLAATIRVLVGCGGHYSFPSSHAANHFALATFWFNSIALVVHRRWYWLWLWAFTIGYAQIYVGKHFPLDIAAGAFLGIIIGMVLSRFFVFWCKRRKALPNHTSSSAYDPTKKI